MCVLLRGVWSLKKASLKCDKLCWWPLNFNTLHKYTCIMIDKGYLAQKWRNITSPKSSSPASLDMGGAPPHTDDRIRQAARGQDKSDCWKTTRQLQITLSVFDALWNISLEHGVALGMNIYWLLNISWIALVTSLPARALTWTLSRHRLNQPSIRRQRLEGTTSKNNELNAYGRKESFLWRHAAAATSLVFPPESIRRSPNHPHGLRGQRPEQRILRKRNNIQPAS